jgi:hypothetical protein
VSKEDQHEEAVWNACLAKEPEKQDGWWQEEMRKNDAHVKAEQIREAAEIVRYGNRITIQDIRLLREMKVSAFR